MIVFGPVPSRRLGQSIGINNIPSKVCSYSCVYCQIGRTNRLQITRDNFYKPEDIFRETEIKMKELEAKKEHPDYITFVPDGEPTLDRNLGTEIDLLKQFGVKIAVITNASLLWMDEVKEDLMKANWISLKIDTVDNDVWHRIDRPHGSLNMQKIMKSTIDFANNFKGTLVTETMLVSGVNDNDQCIEQIGEQLARINPFKAYLLVPTRPPAENGVQRPTKEKLSRISNIVHNLVQTNIEWITGDEEEEGFFFTDDIINDLLSISSVHPVREDIIDNLLKKRNVDKEIIETLIKQNMIKEYIYEGKMFYKRTTKN
ncbi:radical SAM protein [Alicyclobacillaceae bacterium I2511]|nr:radical SAM protein [Alicyclobacillaceae bacterium I2511]